MAATFLNVIRQVPLTTAFEGPWKWMEEKGLTEHSILTDMSEEKMRPTVYRIFFAVFLPYVATPAAFCNLGVGITQLGYLGWCRYQRVNIERKELQTAFVRLLSAAYDFGISYLFGFKTGKIAIVVALALFPKYVSLGHKFLFLEKPKDEKNPSDHVLDPSCAIEKISTALTMTILPPEQGYKAWIMSFFPKKVPAATS